MGVAALTLIANPGSASRKYALYEGKKLLAHLHFEREGGKKVCTLLAGATVHKETVAIANLNESSQHVLRVLREQGIMENGERIGRIGVRIVAPGKYFLEDRLVTAVFLRHLEEAERYAPLHVRAAFEEVESLHRQFRGVPMAGLSDSSFHITKPDITWNYGLPLDDTDRLDIKRFGYHGLSVGSAVAKLRAHEKLPPRVIACHLGSGASVTALWHGRSYDNTMGYSPLEGLVMATRCGTTDISAAKVMQQRLGLSDDAMQDYLNKQSGLLGLSGISSDIRELLEYEAQGHHRAELALATYVYAVQKGIGQMAAALGGVDMLLFTGTVGERSFIMRHRITEKLDYLDFAIDRHSNNACEGPRELTCISRLAHSKPIFVIPADEETEMLRRLDSVEL